MKTYKIEYIKVKKQYASVTLQAENRKVALDMARNMNQEDFEEIESIDGSEWKVKKNWRIWDFFG